MASVHLIISFPGFHNKLHVICSFLQVHWGHPGNMAVVLLAMGGYGAGYLGWQIRTGTDGDVVAKAREAHPKLAAGMAMFFALGAVGGTMSLIMQGKSVFERCAADTGLVEAKRVAHMT